MEKMPLAEYYMIYGEQDLAKPGAQEISAVERLMNEFEAHEGEEGQFLRQYKDIADKTKNPLVKFLVKLIISDEEKHHAVIHAMISTLKGGLHWTSPEGAIQGLDAVGEENGDLLKVTEDFIRHEKETIRQYKRLIKSSTGYYHGLFVLLLRTIVQDSEKHVGILEFLRKRLKEA